MYPVNLKNIKNPPKVLYVEGNVKLLSDPGIAIIGSRNCTDYGKKWCEKFTKGLIQYGLNIISGMARGIDTISHEICIKNNGKTIAILGSGLNNIFPKENEYLYKKILEEGGTIVSEYSPEVSASSNKFLERNRIVSGLSIGVLVIEAAYRSGTSVTAKIAKEQGKKVFCLPGNLENSKSVGTNNLISKGAKLVTNYTDIIKEYKFLHKNLNNIEINEDNQEETVNEEYKEIYKLICEGYTELEKIISLSKENVNTIMSKLTMLEIEGKIKRIGISKFTKI